MKVKKWNDLTVKDDYMFKRLMSCRDICIRLLNSILTFEVVDIEYLNTEKDFKFYHEAKGVRLDVFVKDTEKNVYNIEMQVSSNKTDFANRIRYYQGMMDTSLLERGKQYRNLNKTFIIFICPFKLFDGKRCFYTFRNICVEDKSIELEDGATKILISTKGTDLESVNEDLNAFLRYVNGDSVKDSGFVHDIASTMENIKKDERERGYYMNLIIEMQKRERIGEKRGKKIGKEIGEKIGEKRGKEIGEKISVVNNIKSLMGSLNMSVEAVMNALNIPSEDRDLYSRLVADPSFCEEYFKDASNFAK